MRKSYLIPFLALFVASNLLTSCSEKSDKDHQSDLSSKQGGGNELVKDVDTTWIDGSRQVMYSKDIQSQLDTSVVIGGKKYFLRVSVNSTGAIYEKVFSFERNDSIFAFKNSGPEVKYHFRLYDPSDDIVFDKTYTKDAFTKLKSGSHVVWSNSWDLGYSGYYNQFKSFLFKPSWGPEATDDIFQDVFFLDLNGNIKNHFVNGYIHRLCDCNFGPSPDGKTMTFCDRIVKSDGSYVSIKKENKEVMAVFQVNDNASLVIYDYEGKPPFNNAQILNRNGRLLQSFDFQGLVGELTYRVSKFNSKSGEFIYLLDEPQGIIIALDRKSLEVKRINLSDLNVATEQVLNEGEPMYEYTYENQYNLILHDGVFYRISE